MYESFKKMFIVLLNFHLYNEHIKLDSHFIY